MISQYQLSENDQVSTGIQNLFNRSTTCSTVNNTIHLPAPGTVLTASYTPLVNAGVAPD